MINNQKEAINFIENKINPCLFCLVKKECDIYRNKSGYSEPNPEGFCIEFTQAINLLKSAVRNNLEED